MQLDNTAECSSNAEWKPLCHRYQAVHIKAINVEVGEDRSGQTALWAFAFLSEFEPEALGCWPAPTTVADVLEEFRIRGLAKARFLLCDDAAARFKARSAFPGTVAIPSLGRLIVQSQELVAPRDRRLVAAAVRAIVEARSREAAQDSFSALAAGRLGAAYPSLVQFWSDELERLTPLYALPARLRQIIRCEDGIVQDMQQSLTRSVARHGSFANHEDAVSFIANALERWQRRLEARSMDRVGRLGTAVAHAGSHLGTQPLAL